MKESKKKSQIYREFVAARLEKQPFIDLDDIVQEARDRFREGFYRQHFLTAVMVTRCSEFNYIRSNGKVTFCHRNIFPIVDDILGKVA